MNSFLPCIRLEYPLVGVARLLRSNGPRPLPQPSPNASPIKANTTDSHKSSKLCFASVRVKVSEVGVVHDVYVRQKRKDTEKSRKQTENIKRNNIGNKATKRNRNHLACTVSLRPGLHLFQFDDPSAAILERRILPSRNHTWPQEKK